MVFLNISLILVIEMFYLPLYHKPTTMKTKRNQWAIWICNHCEEEYPYEPAVCNDCGTIFVANKSFTYAADFNFVEPTRERVVPISTRE